MASRILKNNTASPVNISDVGQTVPASGQLTIVPTDYGKYEGSNDVIVFIGNSTLTVNDGTFDLSITEGTRLIQGGFSRPISDGADPTIKATVTDFGGGRFAMEVNDPSTQPPDPTANPGCPVTSAKRRDDFSNSTIEVGTGAYTTIKTVTGNGKFIGFAFGFDSTQVQVRLEVDGEVIFTDLRPSLLDNLRVSGGEGSFPKVGDFLVDSNDIQFYPHCPIAYTTSFTVSARATSGNRDLDEHLVSYTDES